MKSINLKIKMNTIFSVIMLFVFSISMASENKSITAANNDDEKLSFSIYNLKTTGTTSELGGKFSSILNEGLYLENSFIIKSPVQDIPETIVYPDCFTAECISEIKKIDIDGIVIIGSITRFEFKIGERPISKYAVEDIKTENFELTLGVINIRENSLDISYKKKFNNNTALLSEAEKIAKEIREFYLKKNIVKQKKIDEVPVINKIPPEKEKKFSPGYHLAGITMSPSFLVPVGTYSNMTDWGPGLSIDLNGRFSGIPNFFIDYNINLYFLQESRNNIDSITMLSAYVNTGYNFKLPKMFFIAPYLGLGYVFHFINGDKNVPAFNPSGIYTYNREFYYNPSIAAGAEFGYSFSERFHLIINPSYRLFISEAEAFHFFTFNLSLRILW